MSLLAAPLGTQAFYLPLVGDLQTSSNRLAASAERLAGGSAIINAGDNVAALSVSTGFQTQSVGLNQAASNVAQGSSLLEVANGGLTQVAGIIANMQMIATEVSGSALTDAQRGFLQEQFSSDLSAIDTIVSNTSFNGINLIDGTLASGTHFQVGAGQGAGNSINVAIANAGTSALFSSTPKVDSTGDATAALAALTTANNNIQTNLNNVEGLQAAFSDAGSNLTQAIGGNMAAVSNLVDTNIATESTTYAQDTITVNAGIAVLAQARNLSPGLLLLLRPAGHG